MNKEEIFTIYKPIGISPLDAIEIFKKENPEFKNQKMTYAGRLDPMAEGVLLIILGSELKKFSDHLCYDKQYEADILFGFSTDSYDLLGIPKKEELKISEKKIVTSLNQFEGKTRMKIPPFSSYRIKGKPLFKWALEKRLNEIKIPEKETTIYKLEINNIYKIKEEQLREEINKKVGKVKGDFRQKKIISAWNSILNDPDNEYSVVRLSIDCSSGSYIRSLADESGKKLGLKSLLLRLKRTEVGDYNLKNSIAINY